MKPLQPHRKFKASNSCWDFCMIHHSLFAMPISSLPHFFFFSIFLAIAVVSVQGQCLKDQKSLLLELKSEFKFDSSYSKKLVHWNQSDGCCGWDGVDCDDCCGWDGVDCDDCCNWNGVQCDDFGHVISLMLLNESISGEINNSSSLFGFRYLEMLMLDDNALSGNIPHSFFQLHSLTHLSLSNNLFNGTFQLENIRSLPNLILLDLSQNNLSVEVNNVNSSSYRYPKLDMLFLSSCNLHVFPDFIKKSPLQSLDLSDNRIAGAIPSWIWGKIELTNLNLSHNLLVELEKPYHVPTNLLVVDLHSNQLKGELPPIPQQALSVDYSDNNFDTIIPTTNISSYMHSLSLANNSLSGEIPTSLCNATNLQVLDLSFNNLRGNIPLCLLGNMEMLEVLKIRGNNINGSIPGQLPRLLSTLDLSNNILSGKIPKSFAYSKHLKVLDVGYNNFDDSFPCMLPSSLHVLVLRFNRFHGEVRCDKSWPNLQIVDISFNNFSGSLHSLNFSTWRGMILESDPHLRPNHSGYNYLKSPSRYYQDEVTLTVKGLEIKIVKIWPDFTCIDFSSNNFHGAIPDAIGNLSSLYLLNLSHNALTDTIPRSLGALTELESLDLSANQLRGRIPEELARLTFLSFLNLSLNELVGMVPNGRQFQTFSTDSFGGNKELCGFPLNKSCSSPPAGTGITPSKSKDEEIEWEYVFAALGYVVGLGSIAWTLLCWRSFRERYFEKIEEVVDKIFYQRARRQRHERRRRRVEKRKEVRRQQRS